MNMHPKEFALVFVVGSVLLSLPLLECSQPKAEVNGVCPDGMSQCSDDKTCCEREDGHYGCCPYPNAVCCPDKVHCCPYGSVCDVSSGACLRANDPLARYRQLMKVHSPPSGLQRRLGVERVHLNQPEPSASTIAQVAQNPTPKVVPKRNVCPDKMSECPDDATCCLLVSGYYGCCPYPHGVCCNDRLHCCPRGTTCHESQAACKHGNPFLAIISRHSVTANPAVPVPAIPPTSKKVHSKSPPTMSFPVGWKLCSYFNCLENEFCVQRDDRVRACCSLDEGENCPFLRNQPTVCDSNGCVKPDVPPLSTQRKARGPGLTATAGERCKEDICPPGGKYTCCQVEGPYGTKTGCCPVENGTCCSHALVCCPNGYLCSEGANKHVTCISTSQRVALPFSGLKPRQGMEVPPVALLPPAGLAANISTVETAGLSCLVTCRTSNGDKTCCPHANGSCCQGGETCCPAQYSCSLDGNSCVHN